MHPATSARTSRLPAGPGFCVSRPALPLGLLLLFTGCATRAPEPIRLVVISPHRDEIREEVALGFRSWFTERTHALHEGARVSLRDYLKSGQDKDAVLASLALGFLRQHWSREDLGLTASALDRWDEANSPETARALLAALDEWPGADRPIEVIWQDIGGGTSAIARYVRSQFRERPDGIGIDLLFGGGTDIYLRFADEGLLAPLKMPDLFTNRIRPTLNGVPLYDPQGRWFGPMLSSFGILCNREVLRRIGYPGLPQTWDDLGSPLLRSWVGAGDPRLTGSVHMVYEIILQGEGWDNGFRKLTLLGANVHSFIRDSGTLTRAVITGEVAAAGNVDVNALSAVGRNPDVMAFVLPDVQRRQTPEGTVVLSGGTIVNPDAIAVLKGAPRKELARAFVEYTLSDAGQRLFFLRPGVQDGPVRNPLCRLSVVEAMYEQYPIDQRSTGAANPFTQTQTLPYNSKVGEQRWDALNDVLGAVIVDAHEELAAANRTIQRGLSGDDYYRLLRELIAPPCTEAELMAHARRSVEEGPRARAAQLNLWGEAARERYRRIRREAEAIKERYEGGS